MQKVPQYQGGIRPPKMTKRLDLIRGEEEIHRDLILGQYGIVVSILSSFPIILNVMIIMRMKWEQNQVADCVFSSVR